MLKDLSSDKALSSIHCFQFLCIISVSAFLKQLEKLAFQSTILLKGPIEDSIRKAARQTEAGKKCNSADYRSFFAGVGHCRPVYPGP